MSIGDTVPTCRAAIVEGSATIGKVTITTADIMLYGIQNRTHAIKMRWREDQQPARYADAVCRLEACAEFYASTDAAVDIALSELSHLNTPKSGQQPAAPKD